MINYIKTFSKYRYMLELFVRRDLEIKYKGTFLGIMWSLLNPLLQMVVLTILFSTLFKRSIENFPLYLISGKLILDLYVSTTNKSLTGLVSSSSLLKKVNFPKYMLILSLVISNFIIFLISLLDLVLIMVLTKAQLSIYILLAPLILVFYIVFILGASLTLSILNAFFRDIQHLYNVFIMILTYFSAIFYPISIVPERFRFLFYLNPVYIYIEAFRDVVYYNKMPSTLILVLGVIYAITSLLIGVVIFVKKQDAVVLKI